jgi:single-strand DNA-binding protein
MSGYLNKATLIGNLGRDPEVRHLQNGGRVVTMSLATTDTWRDQRGERQERTEWHRIVIWNEGLGKLAEKYLATGAKVYVEGQIKTRKYQDQSGVDRTSTEIHLTPYNGTLTFLDNKRETNEGGAPRGQQAEASTSQGAGDLDDEVPF